ncbi:tyrosine-type recombinase/integrase [Saccharopolyspora sp. NPDC050389]|uniref:tyrosine-type recombinase/integrase n=1 Tax=Saccharopolyspora sp. NPDC050389 TaxID=3155516 RepID=UPI0033CE897C
MIPLADEYYLEEAEFEDLVACTPGRKNQLFLKIKVRTGMRWGEIIALHRHRVFPKQKRIEVFEAFDNEAREIKPYPKSRRKRSVPIVSELADDLDEWFESTPLVPCTTPHRKVGGRQHRCKSGLVVPNSKGGVLNYSNSNFKRDVWTPATTGAELTDVTPHGLRHTYASWLIQAGVPIEVVSKLLGHASVATTERYAHLADSQWDAVRAADGDVLNPVPAPAERPAAEHAEPESAPYLPHENDTAAGAEIIDLFSRRRSAG